MRQWEGQSSDKREGRGRERFRVENIGQDKTREERR